MARRMKRRQMKRPTRQPMPYMYGTRHRRRSNGLGTAVAGSYIGNKLANGSNNRNQYVQQPVYQQQKINEEQGPNNVYQTKKEKSSIFLIVIIILVVLVLFYFLFTEPVYDYYVNVLDNILLFY